MKKHIVFFLYPDVVALDITGPLEVFSTATELLSRNNRKDEGYNPCFASMVAGPVRTSSGLTLYADENIETTNPDILLIPGGPKTESISTDPAIIHAVQAAAEQAESIVSVCSGAFILAACGFLDGKQATTHWMLTGRLAKLYPSIKVNPDALYVQDGNISTSGGVTAGIDLALTIVEEDYGPQLAIEIARILLLYRRRPGHQSQFSSPLAIQAQTCSLFSELIVWMEENLSENLTVERLAEQANMSPRTFARIFPAETGEKPGRFVEQLRIDRAREMIESGMKSFDIVAQESGFGREERLRRAFQRRLGISPAQYRAHFIKGELHEK
ncbi:GlxA family transcriptional regulator [Maridesulfovibrio zosterae]|uniref:GlxA family transcriptional regulator n=1 Tax=Maridesulfovibrio zosterae TaxID=82171 RepID=UPI00041C8D67|nr:GlxA family transcriptional regulator [Maridesulfovibrio zosterae]